jgi:hypothetical protein
MMVYADKVIVNGMYTTSTVSSLLYSSDIGHHTSILFLRNEKKDTDLISIARYSWEHGSQRPNTHTYPIACDKCHKVQSWCPPTAVSREDGASFALECCTKHKEDGKISLCSGTFEVAARPPSSMISAPYVGTWYSHNIPNTITPP